MTKIGYARVSTKSQLENNSLEIQERELLAKGCEKVLKEQYTGKTVDRPIFNKVVKELKEGDVLVVTKLDRFARTTLEGMNLMQSLLDRGIAVEILNFGNIQGGFNSSNKLMFQIFLAFAEYERDMIIERCSSGKERAKEDPDFKEGRPRKFSKKMIDHACSMLQICGGDKSYREVEELTRISSRTLMREVKKRKAKEISLTNNSEEEAYEWFKRISKENKRNGS